MNKYALVVLTALTVTACGNAADTITAPDVVATTDTAATETTETTKEAPKQLEDYSPSDIKIEETAAATTTEVASALTDGDYALDAAGSTITWTGYKPGGNHFGRVPALSGDITITDGAVQPGATFTLDMAGFTIDDLEGDSAAGLKDHLTVPTFFNIAEYPTATLTVTQATQDEVIADLTLNAVTKSITMPVQWADNGDSMMASSEVELSRKAFDLSLEGLKDAGLNDQIDIAFELNFVAAE